VWLLAKNIVFTVLVPAAAGLYVPWWIAGGPVPSPTFTLRSLAGVLLLTVGAAGYVWCRGGLRVVPVVVCHLRSWDAGPH